MYSNFSDDKSLMISFFEDKEEPEVLMTAEFVLCYGEDALPKLENKIDFNSDAFKKAKTYYDSIKYLIDVCGDHAWAKKTLDNLSSNDDAAENALGISRSDASFARKKEDCEISLREDVAFLDLVRKEAVNSFDKISQEVGFRPMSEKDKDVLLAHLYEKRFRGRLRYRVRRNLGRYVFNMIKNNAENELVSIRDLVIEVLKTFEGGVTNN